MLETKDFMPINYLKKEKFTGSFCGLRYRMERTEDEENGVRLRVAAWPEPYAFDATPDEQKTFAFFTFDKDGIAAGVEWLNKQYKNM